MELNAPRGSPPSSLETARLTSDSDADELHPPLSSIGSGFWAGFAQMLKSTLGMGVLFMPYAFSIVGWLVGLIGLYASAALVVYSMWLMIAADDKLSERSSAVSSTGSSTYTSMAYQAGLPRIVVLLAIGSSQIGVTTGYIVYIANNLHKVFPELSQLAAVWLIGLSVIPTVFIRRFSSLLPISIIGLISMVTAFVGLGIHCTSHSEPADFPAYRSEGLFRFLGIAVFAAEGIVNVPTVRASLCEPTRARHSMLLFSSSTFFGCTIFAAAGLAGWACFGDATPSIISANLPNSPVGITIRLALCVHLWCSFPLQIHPVAECTHAWWVPHSYSASAANRRSLLASPPFQAIMIRVYASLLSIVLASFVTGIGSLMSILGWLSFGFLSFVAPPLMYYNLFTWRSFSCSHAVFFVLFTVGGIVFSLVGFVLSFVEAENDTTNKDVISY